MRRILVMLASALTLLGITVAVPQQASATCTAHCSQLSLSYVRGWLIGKSVGPSYYTHYGKATITATYNNTRTGSAYRAWATYNVTYVSPAAVTAGPAPLSVHPAPVNIKVENRGGVVTRTNLDTGQPLTVSPMDSNWWDPTSWDWSGIFGSVWSAWSRCETAVTKTLAVIVGTGLVLKGLVEKALLGIGGPEGGAVLVVGVCISAVFN